VADSGVLAHIAQRSPAEQTLDGIRSAIYREIDGTALRVGNLLRDAKRIDAYGFNGWVETSLPFGVETARRLMAIATAYEKLPTDTLAGMPRPWQAMYALKALPPERLAAGVQSGAISPSMTVSQAKAYARTERGVSSVRAKRCDAAAGALMQFAPNELSPGVRAMLERWLHAQ
jgi:hypothetical protein